MRIPPLLLSKRTRFDALRAFLPTLLLGLLGGSLAYWAGLPLPWLLGAMLATTLPSLAGVQLRSPGSARKAVLAVIGVMLGSAFSPDMAGDVMPWTISLAMMLLATSVMWAFSFWFAHRVAGYSVETALYAGIPGGVSAVTAMAMESGADLRIVGLTHATRILILLLSIPPLLDVLGHVELGLRPAGSASWLWLPSLFDIAWLLGSGVVGIGLGRLLRLPNAFLFGPALVSAALHLTGLTHAVVPPSVLAIAQVIIGVSVGIRFGGTPLAAVAFNLWMATLQAAVLMLIAIAAAWSIHAVTGYSMAAALLANMPGGAPELSLVALSLGIDPAFVTSHHLLRITALMLLMPLMLRAFRRLLA
ncbi:AbrB family transcriptional regulator [Billgrantia diversa]|nr:AbrB family transcriptional regulator [Halomonas sp. MCCC 1A13316]